MEDVGEKDVTKRETKYCMSEKITDEGIKNFFLISVRNSGTHLGSYLPK